MRINNEKGSGLLWIYLTTIILGLSSAALYGMSIWQSRSVTIDVAREKAFYYAEAAVDRKLKEVRLNNIENFSGSIGEGTYNATYDNTNKVITANGTSNGLSRNISAKLVKVSFPGLRGAMTGNGNMSTNGSIVIDGRDYDLNGNVVGPGTYGVSTSGSYSQGGSSQVGGNGTAPADPAPAGTTEENTSQIPLTPEEVLGLPIGSLDQYKTTTLPHLPMENQIVYLTSNNGNDIWNAPDFGECGDHPSSGILIFHNEDTTAELKNIHGCFQGIIITDRLTHINGTAEIFGAVAVLEANSNIGNGNAHVRYSSTAINNVPLSNYSIMSWDDGLN